MAVHHQQPGATWVCGVASRKAAAAAATTTTTAPATTMPAGGRRARGGVVGGGTAGGPKRSLSRRSLSSTPTSIHLRLLRRGTPGANALWSQSAPRLIQL